MLQVTYCSFSLNPPYCPMTYCTNHSKMSPSTLYVPMPLQTTDCWMTYYIPQINWCSPLCMCWCVLRLLLSLNDLLHTSQQNGHSPLCMRWCVFRWQEYLNDLLHTSQQNGLSPLCIHLCVFRLLWSLNDLLLTSQQNGCSPLCRRWGVFRCYMVFS
jgi:hypothetical protein